MQPRDLPGLERGEERGPAAEPVSRRRRRPAPSPPALNRAVSWLALRFPHLSLEALALPGTGHAVLDEHGVVDCDVEAWRHGVRPGMPTNAALALMPSLALSSREPGRESAALDRLAEWCETYTACVSMAPPDILLLEIGGSLRLFGGRERLCREIVRGLRASGFSAVAASAPTPLAACWLSRAGGGEVACATLQSRLSTLPVEVLRWPDRITATLRDMGITRLGACFRLPRDGFARRFGAERLLELDRALGRAPDPRVPRRSAPQFARSLDLPAETSRHDHLLEGLGVLLDELASLLRSHQLAAERLRLDCRHADRTATVVTLELARPTADCAELAFLFDEKLARVALPAPVLALTLSTGRLRSPQRPVNTGLFREPARESGGAGVPEVVERLRVRFGVESVHGLCLVPEHRPESAWCAVRPEAPPRKPPTVRGSCRRPLWMLSSAVALETIDGWPSHGGRLEIERGPERIETGWWDGHDVARDYYVARSPSGTRLWIYRERSGARRWWLHGVFG